MFNKILVALDGSAHAQRALHSAIELAHRCESELVLLHAVQAHAFRSDYDARVIRSAREVFDRVGREQADAILGEAEKEAEAAGLAPVERVLVEGDPVKVILDAVSSLPVDLVVVGTRGLSGLREITLGSVAREISLAAPCRVLIVK